MPRSRERIRTTTLRLPGPVYDQLKSVVEKEKAGAGNIVSFNDAIVSAIKSYLKMYHRRRIDAAFAGMAEDIDYQKEAALLAEDFAYSDWEALEIAEKDLTGEPVEHGTSDAR